MPVEFPLTDQIVEALGVKPIETFLGRDLMLVLEKEEDVQNASPDFSMLENCRMVWAFQSRRKVINTILFLDPFSRSSR